MGDYQGQQALAEESAHDATDLRLTVAVQDLAHLEVVIRALQRTNSVLNVHRARSSS